MHAVLRISDHGQKRHQSKKERTDMARRTPSTEDVLDAFLVDFLNPARDRRNFRLWHADELRKAKLEVLGVIMRDLDMHSGGRSGISVDKRKRSATSSKCRHQRR